jgi:hypothetical protein
MSSYRGLIASHVAYPGVNINRFIPGRFISKDDRQYFVAVTNSTIQLFHADYINSTDAFITPYNEPQPVHATIISTAHLPHTSSAATSLGLSSDALLLLTSTGTLTILQFLSDINKFVPFKYIPLPPPPDDSDPYANLRCDHAGGIAIGTRSDILVGSLLDPSAWVWLFKDSSRSLSLHPPSGGQQEQQHGSNIHTHLLKMKLMTVEQLNSSGGGPSGSISLQGHAHCLLVVSMAMTKHIEKPPLTREEGDIAAKREHHVQEEQQQQQQQQHVRPPAVRTHTHYNVQMWGFSSASNTNNEGTIDLIASGRVDSSMVNGGDRTEKEGHEEEEEENILHQITQLLNEKSKEGPLKGVHHAAIVSQLLLGDNDTTESSGQQSLLRTRYTLLQDLSALYNKDIKAKLLEQPIMSSAWKIPQLRKNNNNNNSTNKAAAVYFSLSDGTIMALQEDEDKDSPGTARLNNKRSLEMIYKLESSVIDMHYLTEGSYGGCLVCVTMSGDVVMIADTTYNDDKKNSRCATKDDVEMTDTTTCFTTTTTNIDSNDRCIWTMVGQWSSSSSSLGSSKPLAAGGGGCQFLLGDCLVADAENLQQNQLYALSPAPPPLSSIQRFFPLSTNDKTATLHVMYPATRPELLLETDDDVFQGVYGMWSASSSSSINSGRNKSGVVVMSTMNESRALKLENETLIDCSDALGIQLSEKTLLWDAMESGWMVQITPTRVWFIAPKSSSLEEEQEESVCWCPPANQSIIAGSICSQYDTVLLCVHDGTDKNYRIVPLLRNNVISGAIEAATETAEQDVGFCYIIKADVSCMSNAMVLLPKTSSSVSSRKEAIVAVGTHTPSVHLLKLSLSADDNDNDSNNVTLTMLTEVAVELRPVPCPPFSPSCSKGRETPGNYQQQQEEDTTAIEKNMMQTDAPPPLPASPSQPTVATTPRAATAPIRALSSPLAAAAAADPLAAWQHIPESLLLLPLPPSSFERTGLKEEDVIMAVGLRTGQLVQLFMKITRDAVVSSEDDIEIMLGSPFIELAAGKQPVKLVPLTGNNNSRDPHLGSPVALALGDRALLLYPSSNSRREEERPSSLHRLSLKPLALPPILAAASLSIIMTAAPHDTTTSSTTTTKNGYDQCLVYSTSEGRLGLISLSHLHSATAANAMATTTTRHIDLDVMHARKMALHPQSGIIVIVGAALNPDDKTTRLCTTTPAIRLVDPTTGQVPQWSSDSVLTTALKSPRGDPSSSFSSRDGHGDQVHVQINNNWGRCHEALSALALSQFKNIPSFDDEVSIAIKELSSHLVNSHGQPAEGVEDTMAAALKKRQHEAMSLQNNNIGAGSRAASGGLRSGGLRSYPVFLRNNNKNSSKRRRREAGIPPSPREYTRHRMEQQLHAKIDSLHTTTTASGGDDDNDNDDDDEAAAEEDDLLSFIFIGTDVRYSDNQMEASVLQSDLTIGEGGTDTRQGQFTHESMKKVVVMDESGERLGGRVLCVSWTTDFNDHTEDVEEEAEEDDKGKGAADPKTTKTATKTTTKNQANQNKSNNGNTHIKLSLVDLKRFDTPILSMCIANLPLHDVNEDQQQGVPPSSSPPPPPAASKRGRVRLIVSTGRHLVSYPILRSGKLGNKVAVICTDRPITYLHWHPSRSNSNNKSSKCIKGHVVGTDGKNGALVWQYHAGDEKPNVDGSKVATQSNNNNINNGELSSSFPLGKKGEELFVLRAVDTEVRTHCLGAFFINNNDDDKYNSFNNDECSRVDTRCVLADGNGSLSVVRPERRIGKLVYLGNTTRYNAGSIATKLLPQGFKFGTTTTASDANNSGSIIPNNNNNKNKNNNNNNFSLVCGDGRVIQFSSCVPYDAVAMPLWKLQSYMAHHPLTAPLSGCDYKEYVGGRVSLLRHPIMIKKKKEEEEDGKGGDTGEGMEEGETDQEHTATTGDDDGDGADASASCGEGQQPLSEALNGALTLTGGSRRIDDALMTLTTPTTTITTATADAMSTNTTGKRTVVGDLILDLNMLQLYEQLPYRDQVDLAMAVVDTGSEEGRGGEEEEEEKEGASSLSLLYVEWVLDLIYKARQYVS